MNARKNNNNFLFPDKNIGFTLTERKLSQLCENTFLKIWSYTSLYNDEGVGKNKKGKEICDLLVYFNNTVVIFSDKEIKYNSEKKQTDDDGLSVAWKRWRRKAVDDSIRQIEGAESWIKTYYDRIYFDEKCTIKFPFIHEYNINKLKIYRVAIANGSPASLYLGCSVEDFIINDVRDSKGNYVHVFDSEMINILTDELSTVREFVQYLDKKEIAAKNGFFNKFNKVSEKDILATYLLSPTDIRGSDFYCDDEDFKIERYDDLINSSDYKNGKEKDRFSVMFDLMINYVSEKFMRGENIDIGYEKFEINQKVIEVLCEFDRLTRRELSENILEKFKETRGRAISSRSITFNGDSSYYAVNAIFSVVIFPKAVCKNMNKEEYANERREVAQAYATHYQYALGKDKSIVVVALDNISEISSSWDYNYKNFMARVCDKGLSLVYRDSNSITEQDLCFFAMKQKQWGILQSSPIRVSNDRVHQYFN
ncbi:hypothetical protein H0249_04825 [Pectobacterium brasiliense]|uniref:hypothetical protein n=1 Tax=Pectobacterium brasiliense TaxID=180957 RepID=UPI0015DDA478|nr:hypothetical protein [Pectobacterium brasiliense]MBA0195836.1 hypothetical protein [Pectobacterium brasiliense]MBN3094204.1 hypothetical protein [Pectobacterium brasiliense]